MLILVNVDKENLIVIYRFIRLSVHWWEQKNGNLGINNRAQWRHKSVMVTQINGNWTIFSTAYIDDDNFELHIKSPVGGEFTNGRWISHQ